MESASIAAGSPRTSTTGRPRPTRRSRIDRQTLGILLFIVSEAMLFGAFFASYFFLREVSNPTGAWPPEGFELPKLGRRVSTPRSSISSSLHRPLGARGRPQGQPQRDEDGPGDDLAARRDLPLHPDQRVRPHRLQRPRRRLRLDLLRPHRPPRRPRLRRPDAAQLRQHPRLARPLRHRREGPPGRRGARASTGTSSTSCGSSSTRPSTSSSRRAERPRLAGSDRDRCGADPASRRAQPRRTAPTLGLGVPTAGALRSGPALRSWAERGRRRLRALVGAHLGVELVGTGGAGRLRRPSRRRAGAACTVGLAVGVRLGEAATGVLGVSSRLLEGASGHLSRRSPTRRR